MPGWRTEAVQSLGVVRSGPRLGGPSKRDEAAGQGETGTESAFTFCLLTPDTCELLLS